MFIDGFLEDVHPPDFGQIERRSSRPFCVTAWMAGSRKSWVGTWMTGNRKAWAERVEQARNRCEHERGNCKMMDGALIDGPWAKNSKEIPRKKNEPRADLRGGDLNLLSKMTPYSRGVAIEFFSSERGRSFEMNGIWRMERCR